MQTWQESAGPTPAAERAAMQAAATLYHRFFTGLILTVVTRRGREDAGELMFRVFRHQHHEKFLPGLRKLGLAGLPDAVAAAGYHYLANRVGGVQVEFMRESDRKAWVRFVPPRWVYDGTAIAGVPTEVSRGVLRGWYAHNGVSLGNSRLGFVCTAQTTDGQHGLAGYFLEHERALEPEERLRFAPGEEPPPFASAAAPALDPADWTPERLAKANRNYAMDYVRSTLPRLAELFGPAEAAYLGNIAARLVAMQYQQETAALLGVPPGGAEGFARYMAGMANGQGDACEWTRDGDAAIVRQRGWRLMRGLAPLHTAVFDAWNGLWQGALAVHDRFLVLEVLERMDHGDSAFVWRIRRRGTQAF
jgi:hypothetical protein